MSVTCGVVPGKTSLARLAVRACSRTYVHVDAHVGTHVDGTSIRTFGSVGCSRCAALVTDDCISTVLEDPAVVCFAPDMWVNAGWPVSHHLGSLMRAHTHATAHHATHTCTSAHHAQGHIRPHQAIGSGCATQRRATHPPILRAQRSSVE